MDSGVASLWQSLDDVLLPLLRHYRADLQALNVIHKNDRTLLSEADLAAQRAIVDAVERYFPGSAFIAEESDGELPRHGTPVWIIDPIDGTREFVSSLGREFCSVVCRLDDGVPTAAYILAPELAADGGPLAVHWTDTITINNEPAMPLQDRPIPARASVTRSAGSAARPYETDLRAVNCTMKLRTTSQTLDMVRTCMDLSRWTSRPEDHFDVFYRQRQKIWDGAAGIGVCTAMGRIVRNGSDNDPIPLTNEFLDTPVPTFSETIAGGGLSVEWFIRQLTRPGE